MKYSIIYADPAWRYKNWSMKELAERGEKWARANGRSPYDVMDTKAIAALPVKDISAKDCVLFLWATYCKLPECLQVMEAWGFTFKTVGFTWIKLTPRWNDRFWKFLENTHPEHFLHKLFHFGMGFWTHQNPEIVLLGTRGHPKRVDKAVANLVISPLGAHSAKPPVVRDRIVQLIGDLPRIELFAREVTPGWAALGDEIDGKDIRDALKEIIDA